MLIISHAPTYHCKKWKKVEIFFSNLFININYLYKILSSLATAIKKQMHIQENIHRIRYTNAFENLG